MITSYREKLCARNKPIRIGVAGAGAFSRELVTQVSYIRNMEISAIADLSAGKAAALFLDAGYAQDDIVFADSVSAAIAAMERGKRVVVEDGLLLPELPVDAVCDITGMPVFGAAFAEKAILRHRHVIVVNIESDVAVGAILRRMAEKEGVVYTEGDGDQPSLIKGLCDFCETLGIDVFAAGKWTHVTPEERWTLEGKRSDIGYSDGSKNQVEMCCVANMTGLLPDRQGMHMPSLALRDVMDRFDLAERGGIFKKSGVVDVINCLSPDGTREIEPVLGGGVFVVAEPKNPTARQVIREKGFLCSRDGARALLYRPYHFVGIETPISIMRAVLDQEATGAPLPTPVADVCAIAKKDLLPGETLDGIGGCTVRGEILPAAEARKKQYLPLGLAQDVRVNRFIAKGTILTYRDLERPETDAMWRLRSMQDRL